jgi:acetyl esterase
MKFINRLLKTPTDLPTSQVVRARMFQFTFPALWRLVYDRKKFHFATKLLPPTQEVRVPTRHGDIRAILYTPPAEAIAQAKAEGKLPPVHLLIHGGAFVIRYPEQDANIAEFIASELGAYVLLPDYDSAPTVRFPVSEHQTYDVYKWMLSDSSGARWDTDRITIGGASSGAKLTMSVVHQAILDDVPLPLAVSVEFGAFDIMLPDSERVTTKKRPIVTASMIRMARETYFFGIDPSTEGTSPAQFSTLSKFPPTLVMTGGLDTLRLEGEQMAERLVKAGVKVTYKEFTDSDHGFTHGPDLDIARESIGMIGTLLANAYGVPDPTPATN